MVYCRNRIFLFSYLFLGFSLRLILNHQALLSFRYELRARVTEARIDSAISKIGPITEKDEPDFARQRAKSIVKAVVCDILDEEKETEGLRGEVDKLIGTQRSQILQRLRNEVRKVVAKRVIRRT